MNKRPELNKNLDGSTFRSFYYLKEELAGFCRQNGLPASGGKIELTERIAHYLETGEILTAQKIPKTRPSVGDLTDDTLIEPDFVCSEKHRSYFRSKIGPSFTFQVAFQKWLKSNTGKTYRQAVEAYYVLLEKKKESKTIGLQFEYNTYIRDFFADNTGRTLEDAIQCWKYKKGLQGHNRYEKGDLIALKD